MSVDEELHKSTQYRIPKLAEQIENVKKECTSYMLLEFNWDGYGASIIDIPTINLAISVLDEVFSYFKNNIGFLNNRRFDVISRPQNDGNIAIKIIYDC